MPSCCPFYGTSSGAADQEGEFEVYYVKQERVLGVGSKNISVVEAACKRTGRMVAVKTYVKSELNKKDLGNMRAELKIHVGLRHPAIVEVLDVFETRQKVYIVLEQLQGGELFERVQRDGPIGEQESAQITLQLLRALAYLHARGVIHRDIKMENLIFAQPGGRIKLIDFGLAGQLGGKTTLRQSCGTIGYAAPEVLKGGAYSESVDLWSLGAVVYGMLTGNGLFDGEDEELYRANVANDIRWSSRFSALPLDTQTFLRSLLATAPQSRPSVLQATRDPWLRRCAPEAAAEADFEAMQTALDAIHEEAENQRGSRRSGLKDRAAGALARLRRPSRAGTVDDTAAPESPLRVESNVF